MDTPEPSDSDGPPSQVIPSLVTKASAPTSEIQDEISDENDEDEDEDEDSEDLALTDLELDLPTTPHLNLGLEALEDDLDLNHDLYDLTIIELGAGLEEETRTDLDDFRDLDDDYAAYAFDPDEVFDGEEVATAEPNDWLVDKLSREERALQKAAELIGKANWPLSTLSCSTDFCDEWLGTDSSRT